MLLATTLAVIQHSTEQMEVGLGPTSNAGTPNARGGKLKFAASANALAAVVEVPFIEGFRIILVNGAASDGGAGSLRY